MGSSAGWYHLSIYYNVVYIFRSMVQKIHYCLHVCVSVLDTDSCPPIWGSVIVIGGGVFHLLPNCFEKLP